LEEERLRRQGLEGTAHLHACSLHLVFYQLWMIFFYCGDYVFLEKSPCRKEDSVRWQQGLELKEYTAFYLIA